MKVHREKEQHWTVTVDVHGVDIHQALVNAALRIKAGDEQALYQYSEGMTWPQIFKTAVPVVLAIAGVAAGGYGAYQWLT